MIVHLLRRQAAKPVDWGAMRFLMDTLSERRRRMEWEDLLLMAARCLLLALAALLNHQQSGVLRWGAWLVVTGTVIFCGSIYLHIISGHLLSGVAPVGGLLMMAGWGLVVLAFLRRS